MSWPENIRTNLLRSQPEELGNFANSLRWDAMFSLEPVVKRRLRNPYLPGELDLCFAGFFDSGSKLFPVHSPIIGQTESSCNRSHRIGFAAQYKGMPKTKEPTYAGRWRRIEEAMGLLGITSQKALADLLGVSQPTVSGWKKGDYTPEPDKIEKLSEKSGLCINYLWMGQGPKFPDGSLPADVQELVDHLLEMQDDSHTAEVLRFARFRGKD